MKISAGGLPPGEARGRVESSQRNAVFLAARREQVSQCGPAVLPMLPLPGCRPVLHCRLSSRVSLLPRDVDAPSPSRAFIVLGQELPLDNTD